LLAVGRFRPSPFYKYATGYTKSTSINPTQQLKPSQKAEVVEKIFPPAIPHLQEFKMHFLLR
jgi:hypothetical protein